MPPKPVNSKIYSGVYTNKLKNGDIAFYVNYRNESGKPTLKKVGTKTKHENFTIKQAHDKLIEIKHKLQTGEELPVKNLRKNRFTLGDAWKYYYEHAQKDKETYKKDEQLWRNYLSHLENREVRSLTVSDAETLKERISLYISPKTKKPLSNRTQLYILGTLRHIINHAIKHEKVKNYTNPLSGGKVKLPQVDNSRYAFLTYEQADNLLFELNKRYPRLYQLTILLLYTGARFSEVTNLTWREINFDTEMIYFKPTKQGNARHITMTDLVKKTLVALKNEEPHQLVIPNSDRKKYEQMPKQWQNVCDKVVPGNQEANAKDRITVHNLRHTHASWLAMDGLDILHIKEQLGHKKLEMTLRYSHLIPNTRHEATKNLKNFKI